MAEPRGFSIRMQGLNLVPEPLWWLLGAIVSFYFGARELHHQRRRGVVSTAGAILARGTDAPDETPPDPPVAALASRAAAIDPDRNAAVEEWRRQRA